MNRSLTTLLISLAFVGASYINGIDAIDAAQKSKAIKQQPTAVVTPKPVPKPPVVLPVTPPIPVKPLAAPTPVPALLVPFTINGKVFSLLPADRDLLQLIIEDFCKSHSKR